MKQRQSTVTDADIHALIDGELDEPRRSEIQEAITADKALQERAHQYQLLNRQLVKQARNAEDKPISGRLLHAALGHHRRPRPYYTRAAGLVLAGVLVGYLTAVGTRALKPVTPMLSTITTDLVKPAVTAHAVYSPEIKHPVEVTADQEAHLIAWLSKRLHREVKAPQLGEEGFALVGGRLLPSNNGLAAQFMYENDQAQRITLYMRQGLWDNRETAFRYGKSGDSHIFYWIDGPMGYALTGNLSKETLFRLSQIVYGQLDSSQ